MSFPEEILSAAKNEISSGLNKIELQKRLKEIQFINKVLLTLIKTTDMDSTLAAILDLAIKITRSEAGGVLHTGNFLSQTQIMLLRGDLKKEHFQKILNQAGLTRRLETAREIICLKGNSEGFSDMAKADPALLSLISVPMIVGGKTVGILVLMHRQAGREDHRGEYSSRDITTISVFASQAALVLHNTLLKIENGKKEAYLETIAALVSAIDAKDRYTRNHSKNVARMAATLSRGLKLGVRETNTIEYGALLHDIGKIGIPESILNKKGKLKYEEFEIVKKHPVIGIGILQPVKFLKSINAIVHYHHERIDGRGYPDGLKGEGIPYEARIVSIADAWDAMTSARSYRGKMSTEQALFEMHKHAGGQFDAYMVKVFLTMVKQEPSLFESV